MTTNHLISIQAVNLSNIIDDTRQLSVKRGGSLLLKQAIDDIKDIFSSDISPISSGASIGLFETTNNTQPAKKIENKISKFLNANKNYKHLTFVVDSVAYEKDKNGAFQIAKEKVLALNSFRQFQQSTLAIAEENTDKNAEPCAWDNIRPSATDSKQYVRRGTGKPATTSLSSSLRHAYGRDEKHNHINKLIGTNHTYVKDLHELCESKEFGNLNDKMAVIYFDGNSFSSIQRKCETAEQLTNFDQYIQARRIDFLAALINKASKDDTFKNGEDIRLELLLWGGDEMILVVPAWKGMEVLQLFYTTSKNWKFEHNNDDHYPLTHAGGLVFCHVKTPIEQIRELAKEIADYVKENAKHGRKKNLYDYLALESIDYPTQKYGKFLEKRFKKGVANWRALSPQTNIKKWETAKEKFIKLTEGIHRRQIYRLASSDDYAKDYKKYQSLEGEEIATAQLKQLKEILGKKQKDQSCWLHLIELWDYYAAEAKN